MVGFVQERLVLRAEWRMAVTAKRLARRLWNH